MESPQEILMSEQYTAASFTKNFSWNHSYKRLHTAIKNGFSAGLSPVTRDVWRKRSEIGDADRELIPLNFFLYSKRGINEDFVMADRLVERSQAGYDLDFARLALFAFHLAMSGNWHRSKWPDGKVAGWGNEFIRTMAWSGGQWNSGAFTESSLKAFIAEKIEAEPMTRRKVFTNYRFMLASAGVLANGELQPADFKTHWPVDAIQLFWDRQIFVGELDPKSDRSDYHAAFIRHEIHKLLGCSEVQGRAFVFGAYRDYSAGRAAQRYDQLDKLKGRLAA
jgi:hypothetical protein